MAEDVIKLVEEVLFFTLLKDESWEVSRSGCLPDFEDRRIYESHPGPKMFYMVNIISEKQNEIQVFQKIPGKGFTFKQVLYLAFCRTGRPEVGFQVVNEDNDLSKPPNPFFYLRGAPGDRT